jgi:hypothetical protein
MSKSRNTKNSSRENALPGVSERAIEDWLAKVSERGYQTAFCHLVNAMGYTVVHSTTHGAAEEGKDIIALDTKGQPVAFQLKRGKISLSHWRMMKSEIDELVEQPINSAYVKSRKQHRPILVTTGSIHEEVGRRITGLNRRWSHAFRPLETWKGTEVLAAFLAHTGRFLPAPIPEFHRLLGFMIADGQGLLDKVEFDRLLRSVLPIDAPVSRQGKAPVVQAIPAAAIVVEYALGGFDKAGNHFAKIEAYTMLMCYILALAERFALPERLWRPTCDNLEGAVDRYAGLLADEALHAGTFGQVNPHTEPIVAPYRAGLLAGAISAHCLWHALGGRSAWYGDKSTEVGSVIKRLIRKVLIPSEAIVPALFLASQYLRQNGEIVTGDNLLRRVLVESIMRKRGQRGVRPLWGPYLNLEEAILRDLGRPIDPRDREAWEHRSYTAWPLVLIVARRLERRGLELFWHSITSMHFVETFADQAWRQLLWHVDRGTSQERLVPCPTKWHDLHEEAARSHKLPKWFNKYRHWLPYYLLVYPHRFTPGLVLGFDDALCGSQKSGL